MSRTGDSHSPEPTRTTVTAGSTEAGWPAEATGIEQTFAEEVLVEEVSIDGMCGVY